MIRSDECSSMGSTRCMPDLGVPRGIHLPLLGLLCGRVEEQKNRELSTAACVHLAAFFCLIFPASVWSVLCVFGFILGLLSLLTPM